MKTKIGIVLVVLGAVLITSALGLFLYNAREQKHAADAVDELMRQIVDEIYDRQNELLEDYAASDEERLEMIITDLVQKQMPVVEIDGYAYIGFVGIPTIGSELPVMAEWSYPKLKISPCRFSGDMYSDDLVIMAHNYDCHFGSLQKLRIGDAVTFTDMDGVTMQYEVAAIDVLEPTAVEEMIAGDYDLTLFTCTYGGERRVTVRCDRT